MRKALMNENQNSEVEKYLRRKEQGGGKRNLIIGRNVYTVMYIYAHKFSEWMG